MRWCKKKYDAPISLRCTLAYHSDDCDSSLKRYWGTPQSFARAGGRPQGCALRPHSSSPAQINGPHPRYWWHYETGVVSLIAKAKNNRRKRLMSAHIFDSKPLAKRMKEELQGEAERFRRLHSRPAKLAQIIVGHDGAAEVYSRQLARACERIGLDSATLAHPFEMEEQALRAEVAALSNDANTDGVVLLLPLPSHIRQRIVTDVLNPEKDVDGLGSRNAGNLLLGFPSFIPSTADVILTVLKHEGIPVAGRNAVVVGRSNIGGKPTALVLMRNDATVTICHSHTHDLTRITTTSDILDVSIGRQASHTPQ